MDGFAPFSGSGALFAEDFDLPAVTLAPAPPPQEVEPAYTREDLATARELAWCEGHAAGRQEAIDSEAATTRRAIVAIAEQIVAERGAAAAWAEQTAEAIACLLMDSLAAAFPTLCARYGDAEVAALIRLVLPALAHEPTVAVRAHPQTAAAVMLELRTSDPELATHIETIDCASMPQGDVRVAWRNGGVTRDASTLWQQVASVLAPAGLLHADTAMKEMVDVG